MAAVVGSPAPDFTLFDQSRTPVSLESLKGRKTLVVFIPFPFTGVCDGELCDLRDNMQQLSAMDANVVVVTCSTLPVNAKWADEQGFDFPVLTDFWPHGVAAKSYGCFNEKLGVANRSTYVLDEEGIVRDIISSDAFGVPRPIASYHEALAAL